MRADSQGDEEQPPPRIIILKAPRASYVHHHCCQVLHFYIPWRTVQIKPKLGIFEWGATIAFKKLTLQPVGRNQPMLLETAANHRGPRAVSPTDGEKRVYHGELRQAHCECGGLVRAKKSPQSCPGVRWRRTYS